MTDAVMQSDMTAPAFEKRDDIGRLVSVTWYGPGAGNDAGGPRWLVAIDGSEFSHRAVAMVAALAALEQGAEIDLVHIHPWLNKEAAETELPRRGWAATAQARQMVDAAKARWRLHVVMGEAASGISQTADLLSSRCIAIGSRGQTATASLLLGSVAYKVVHSAKLPVLIVR